MKKYNFLLLAFLAHCSLFAQREYNVCDSSSFTLNNDTTIVAGKRNLYVHTNSTLSPLYDFTTTDTNEYIRDFDIVKPDLWFTVVGSRYIGGLTQLYRSSDRGQTWDIDSAHYNASNAQSVSFNFLRSINNLQHINGDTLIMFMHYYESGIIYSTDAGSTWTKWFDNLIVHYQGMLSCNDKYYLYSFEGDAFRPWMFGFDKTLLFSPDTNGAWNSFSNMSHHPSCSTSNDTVNCVYASTSNSRCGQYTHFKNYVDSICLTSDITSFERNGFELFPNPVTEFLTIRIPFTVFSEISIYTILGSKMMNTPISKNESEYLIDVRDHPVGMYILHINDGGSFNQMKYIKK